MSLIRYSMVINAGQNRRKSDANINEAKKQVKGKVNMREKNWIVFIVVSFLFMSLWADWDELGELTSEEKIYGLSLIWKEADYNFPHFHQIEGLDWDAEYRRFLSEITETGDIYEYYLKLQQFTALLKDCHTRVIFPQNFSHYLDYPLLRLERIEERVIVSRTGRRHADILPTGSQILEVDGEPVDRYLEKEVLPYIAASNQGVLYNRGMSMLFFGLKDSEVEVKFRYPPDYEKDPVLADRTGVATLVRSSVDDRWSGLADDGTDLLFHRWLDDDILYVALYSFNDELIIRMFDSILHELRECRGLILDLRENKIGRREVSDEILKYLTEEEILTGIAMETRKNISLYKAWGTPIHMYSYLPPEEYRDYGEGNVWHREERIKIENDSEREKIIVPLVILIGHETAFAAEDFLVALQSAREGVTLVGSHTAGSRGQALILRLPGGGHIFVSTHRDIYNDDKILTRVGIQPDAESKLLYEDYLNDTDTVLEKGYQIMRGKLTTADD